jgi:hypothetical protein
MIEELENGQYEEEKAYKVAHSYDRVADGLRAMNEIIHGSINFLHALQEEPILHNQIQLPFSITIKGFTLRIDVSWSDKP